MNHLKFTLLLLLFNATLYSQKLLDCFTCANKLIKTEQIKNLSIDEIRFLTNDIFARKGHKFESGEIDFYYSNKSWYKPVSDNKKIVFNDIEKQNIKLLQDKTVDLKKDRELLITELKKLKSLVTSNSTQELKNKYSYNSGKEEFEYLKQVFEKINLEDINWFKNKGLYEITIDNGDYVRVYQINITGNQINFHYNNQGGSHIDENPTLYPSDYNIEFAYFWEFKFENSSLKFIKLNVAG